MADWYTGVMAAAVHAFDLLTATSARKIPPVCAVFGDEAFLRRQAIAVLRREVLGDEEGDFSLRTLEGPAAALRDVLDELATLAMFGSGRRLVVVEQADEFVTRWRAELEDYVAQPIARGGLVLGLDKFPSNTRLYKAVAASGLLVDCSAPEDARLGRWLVDWAARTHQAKLERSAAGLLVEPIGPELGLRAQELAKLAVLAGPNGKSPAQLVREAAGGGRTRTTWEMLDAALAGDLRSALAQLDRLFAAGETPIGLLGQIAASLRRFAAATRLVLAAEQQGRRIGLRGALEEAGVRSFVLQKAERDLRRLGRERAGRLYRWLLEADLDLKGDSSLAPRVVLERLIVRVAAAPTS